jgi:hypothetical protein
VCAGADLDVEEAVVAGSSLLPRTDLIHGRPSNPESHRWFHVSGPVASREWQFTEAGNDKPTMLCELRAGGRQTLVPPSVHPEGEQYRWEREGEPGEVAPDDLSRRMGQVAALALIARHWPGQGSRDKAAMALSGLLLRAGWSDDETDRFVRLVAICARDDEYSSREKASATRRKLEQGQPVTGAPALTKLLIDGERVVATTRDWLGMQASVKDGVVEPAAWDTPVSLPDLLPPVTPLPPAIIPEPLRAWAQDGAERIGCPLDFIAAAAIVVASSIVGRRVGIHPKQWDDWLLVPNLWGMLVGRPSTRKSPGLAEAMRGLGATLAAEETRYATALELWLRDYLYPWEGRKQVREEEMKEAKKKKNAARLAELLHEEAKDHIGQPAPHMRRYKTEDATVEKLGELLADNPLGLLCHRDELAGWLRSLDKPGREGDRAFYCESWNGTGSFDTDRISRGSIHIEALCLSIIGTIQPGPLSSYVYDSVAGGAGDDGMLQRFQLPIWPDPPTSFRNVDRAPDAAARHRAYEVFVKLSTLSPEQVGATLDADAEPGDREYAVPALRFNDEAQTVFNGWYEGLMNRLRATPDLPPAMEAHMAKFPSLVPSLALLFALMGMVDGSMPQGEVGVAAVDLAILWAEYLEPHAERLYAAVTSATLLRAGRLLVKLRQGMVADGGTVRELYRPQWTGLKTEEEVSDALAMLEAYGWVRVQRQDSGERGGQPARRVWLNPDLPRSPVRGASAAENDEDLDE